MLYDNLEKLFLIPFFKLFEIFYINKNDEKKYNELKKENFGENFDDLKILKTFEKQIKLLMNYYYLQGQIYLLVKKQNL